MIQLDTTLAPIGSAAHFAEVESAIWSFDRTRRLMEAGHE